MTALLKNLNPQEIQALLSESTKVNFLKGAMVFEQGAFGDVMYLIDHGQVGLSRLDPSGRELTLAILGPGDFFGEMALIDGSERSTNAIARTELTLSVITRYDFQQTLLKQPQIAGKIIATLCQRLRDTDQLLQEMTFGNVKERLINLLLDKTGASRSITLTDTHQEIAARIGASRETVTRLLAELRHEGWTIKKG